MKNDDFWLICWGDMQNRPAGLLLSPARWLGWWWWLLLMMMMMTTAIATLVRFVCMIPVIRFVEFNHWSNIIKFLMIIKLATPRWIFGTSFLQKTAIFGLLVRCPPTTDVWANLVEFQHHRMDLEGMGWQWREEARWNKLKTWEKWTKNGGFGWFWCFHTFSYFFFWEELADLFWPWFYLANQKKLEIGHEGMPVFWSMRTLVIPFGIDGNREGWGWEGKDPIQVPHGSPETLRIWAVSH